MTPLKLFYRDGCHLCEDMLEQLQQLQREQMFPLELVDIDRDPAMQSRYNDIVPVLENGDGIRLSEYFLDEAGLRRYLQGG
ncbi:MAG: glutaredoxin family protein [gamma proteobacterium endosymbiont of Lamellibrachia anaximandri]|nr:glutaredoxin family protein [gamma proteobacterium endosymbiont of Lamellibrachia anaximandri]MBL3618068.1 glutaredoxin family protein [gamma proteobacterium endosymbiont of Lamellibrachia anaximandri]